MRSRRVWRFEKPYQYISWLSFSEWRTSADRFGLWGKELQGEVIGVIGQCSDLVCDLLHPVLRLRASKIGRLVSARTGQRQHFYDELG